MQISKCISDFEVFTGLSLAQWVLSCCSHDNVPHTMQAHIHSVNKIHTEFNYLTLMLTHRKAQSAGKGSSPRNLCLFVCCCCRRSVNTQTTSHIHTSTFTPHHYHTQMWPHTHFLYIPLTLTVPHFQHSVLPQTLQPRAGALLLLPSLHFQLPFIPIRLVSRHSVTSTHTRTTSST